jgi:hypothetical protein
MGAERERVRRFGPLDDGLRQASDWYLWGPYVSERQWGTVREDYSADGRPWAYLPHDHARSRAYRWGEDGLAGFSDVEQRLCLGLALWNGRDPILKERAFGLAGAEANHRQDVKEYWWYLDAVPSHAWQLWRYHYPQAAFPYADLVRENGHRGRLDPGYELLDTGAFDDDRYWIVEVCYAKADPADLLMTITVTNAGPQAETVHVLPTAWFRNTWSWDHDAPKPLLRAAGSAAVAVAHPFLGMLELLAGAGPDGAAPTTLFCENETNTGRVFGITPGPPYPKDGINDHVVHGAATVNPSLRGTKCAFWHRCTVAPGATAQVRLRLRPCGSGEPAATALGIGFDRVVAQRRAEADEFYAELTPGGATADETLVMRQAFAGMLWNKQLYNYDVARWLDGDPAQPVPPAARHQGRNARWRNFGAFDIMSMPDKWEYPWFAAWDLAFHCVALAHLDPAFAKYQLLLLCREWVQQPSGALPAYEWDFDDLNPPVQAWAALEVFAIDGSRDTAFLSRVFDKLLINFTWWANVADADGGNIFGGGRTLDRVGPAGRPYLPPGSVIEQADATGWLAFFAISMAGIAAILHRSGQRPGIDLVLKFLEHFAAISGVIDGQGIWDSTDGLYYDRTVLPGDAAMPVQIRSMPGIIAALAVAVIDERMLDASLAAHRQFADFLDRRGASDRAKLGELGLLRGRAGEARMLLSVAGIERLERLFTKLFDEGEFLSPYGLRALSAYHRDDRRRFGIDGDQAASAVAFPARCAAPAVPAAPLSGAAGKHPTWQGPLWFPLNYLVISALERYHQFFGDELEFEYPTGSGRRLPLDAIARDLQDRLISIFIAGPDGRRPCFGRASRLQRDPAWKDNLVFNEYFHGDNAAGLGASHQTGWTGVIADVIRRRHGALRGAAGLLARATGEVEA